MEAADWLSFQSTFTGPNVLDHRAHVTAFVQDFEDACKYPALAAFCERDKQYHFSMKKTADYDDLSWDKVGQCMKRLSKLDYTLRLANNFCASFDGMTDGVTHTVGRWHEGMWDVNDDWRNGTHPGHNLTDQSWFVASWMGLYEVLSHQMLFENAHLLVVRIAKSLPECEDANVKNEEATPKRQRVE